MKKIYKKRDDLINSKLLFLKPNFLFLFLFITNFLSAQITVAPMSCYPQYGSASAMDAAAASTNGTSPFATWKGAFDFAVANGILTIDFVEGTYSTDLSGFRSDWGDADGGFVLPTGMTVNGNGAVIDNSPVGSSQICFATLSTNSSVNGFVFKQLSGNPNGGALYVPSSADNWTINDCDFFNCNQGTDALIVNMGANFTGNITDCDFYGNSNPGATYPQSPGLPSSSALDISGSLTSDLNITNSTFSCNFRNVSGGAVQIHSAVHVDFDGCSFYRNEANASRGGAISIRNGAEVIFNNTNFIENFATSSSSADVGAINIESGSTVDITNCYFKDNDSDDDIGAILVSGASASSISFLTITNTIFEENSASDDGGTVELNSYSNTNIDNCLFLNNSTTDKGGAIYTRSTSNKTILIQNTTITGNTEGSSEGAITANGTHNFTIDNCVITGNTNRDIDVEEGTVTVTNTYYGVASGSISGSGNTSGYTATFDGNYNDSSGAGWTGTYSTNSGAGSCPTPPSPSSNCVDQGSISGVTFDDSANDDGIDDGIPLAGVLVQLYSCSGVYTGTSVTTGSTGEFYFGGLENGNCYYLVFTAPGLYNSTYQDAPGSTTENDSDMNPGNGQSPQITINTSPNSVNITDDVSNETHYVTVDAGFTTSVLPLPVELLNFNGYKKDESVNLEWKTGSEINNQGFYIERSSDGSDWEKIGWVEGNNNTNSESSYYFKDNRPFNGLNYYRLKQMDWNDKFEYSNIINVKIEAANSQFEIYPNPVNEKLNIILDSNQLANGTISFFDFSGKSVLSLSKNFNKGQNTLPINISSLENGIYFIQITLGSEIFETIKFVKN